MFQGLISLFFFVSEIFVSVDDAVNVDDSFGFRFGFFFKKKKVLFG